MDILPTVGIVVHVCVLVELGVAIDVFLISCTRGSGGVDVAVGLFVVGCAHLCMVTWYILAVGVMSKRMSKVSGGKSRFRVKVKACVRISVLSKLSWWNWH